MGAKITRLERASHRSRSVPGALEETERLLAIADEQILCLLIMIEHHLASLATDAGLFVAAECRMRRIGVIAVGPHAPCLNLTAKSVSTRAVARPHTGTQTVHRIVGDLERFIFVFESRHRHHWTENFFLEDTHLVVTAKDG